MNFFYHPKSKLNCQRQRKCLEQQYLPPSSYHVNKQYCQHVQPILIYPVSQQNMPSVNCTPPSPSSHLIRQVYFLQQQQNQKYLANMRNNYLHQPMPRNVSQTSNVNSCQVASKNWANKTHVKIKRPINIFGREMSRGYDCLLSNI